MRFNALIGISLVVLIPSITFAWGGDGHQLICLIAEDRLTPAADAWVHALVGKNNYMSDAENANWADRIRRDRPETESWHFVDIPTDAKGFDEKRDGQQGNNVIDKIADFEAVLKDTKASKSQKVEALKFLVHFVGDLHQPLHTAERNHDQGGNLRLVFFLDWPDAMNLHSAWDSTILLHHMGSAMNLGYSDKLNAAITPAQAAKWAKGTPTDWANESHDVAVKSAYANLPADGPPPKLDKKYVEAAGLVIDTQLERGGVRLATILNGIFTTMPPAATTRR